MFCSKCGKEIDDSAIVCTGCGCPTLNYQKGQNNSTINKSYEQAKSSSVVKLTQFVNTIDTAFILTILSFFVGIGLIFIILAKVKIDNLPRISTIPSDQFAVAQYESAQHKLKTTRKLLSISTAIYIISIFISLIILVIYLINYI